MLNNDEEHHCPPSRRQALWRKLTDTRSESEKKQISFGGARIHHVDVADVETPAVFVNLYPGYSDPCLKGNFILVLRGFHVKKSWHQDHKGSMQQQFSWKIWVEK